MFRPAKREQTPLIIGLAGPSKSGKTYSALRLATGMANGKPIAFINTEGARGHLYAEKFKYVAADIGEPFSYERYREAIAAAKELNPGVLIIDSLSHAHEGPGGMLDQHEKNVDRMSGGDFKKRDRMTWAAWIKPKAEETQFINSLIQLDFPVVLCFRAKEKLKIVKGEDPIPLGWQPICSDRIPFETTATLVLPPGSKGTPDMDAKASELREPMDALIKPTQINEELGKRLAVWAAGRTETPAPPKSHNEAPADPPELRAGAGAPTDSLQQKRPGADSVAYLSAEQVTELRDMLMAAPSSVQERFSLNMKTHKWAAFEFIPASRFKELVEWIEKRMPKQ